MPNISKGPRLWKRPAEAGRQALWIVKDKDKRISTGCVANPTETHPPEAAEKFFDYIAAKYAPERTLRKIEHVSLADVLLIYHLDRRDRFAEETQQRRFDASIGRLNEYFGERKLSDICQGAGEGKMEVTADSGRGAGALKDKARSVRVINNMTAKEAPKAGVDKEDRFDYIRVGNGKSNLTKRSGRSEWRRMVSVRLNNGLHLWEPGDSVGVVTEWRWPSPEAAIQDVGSDDFDKIKAVIAEGNCKARETETLFARAILVQPSECVLHHAALLRFADVGLSRLEF